MSHFSTIKTKLKEAKPLIRSLKELGYEVNQDNKFVKGYKGQYTAVHDLFTSEDFIEGPVAFAEKRAPNWKGK